LGVVEGRIYRLAGSVLKPGASLRLLDGLFVVITAAYVLWPALTEQPRALGDAREYMLMADSLYNHGSPDLRDEDVRWPLAQPLGPRVDGTFAPMYGGYEADRDKRVYSIHFWAYPLFCVPAKAALRLLGENELKAFQVTNAVLFLVAVLRARRRHGRVDTAGLALAALLVLSPAAAFVLWPHPEAFSCALVVLSLVLWKEGRLTSAVGLTAVASVQHSPLVILAAFLWWEAVRPGHSRDPGPLKILGPTLALLPALCPFAFYQIHFGRPSLLSATGAVELHNASLRKTLEVFFDLNLGMLPYVPLALLGAVTAPVVQVSTLRPARTLVKLWAVLVAMAFACSLAANWNHGSFGPMRYAIWLLPVVLAILVHMLEPGVANERTRRAFGALTVCALASQAAVVASHGKPAPRQDHLEHSYLAAFVLQHTPGLYAPSPEIFVERTLGQEMANGEIPKGAAVIYEAHGRCFKALTQKRYWPDLLAHCGPAARAPDFKELAAGRQRDNWVYVDY
jgi:hypothetical protein